MTDPNQDRESDAEAFVMWADVIDEVAAGRAADLPCPYCQRRPLTVEQSPSLTRVSCAGCRRFIEGQFGES